MRRKTYWVYLNGKYIADYRTLRGCLNYIERRKLEYNYDNDLGIIDNEGNEYHPYTGKIMNESINEWNFWDGDNRRSSSAPRQTRLIDVADKMRREQMFGRRERYNNDPEYHAHIKRLEDELRRTDDPQHAEYLERRISKLRSLSEGVEDNIRRVKHDKGVSKRLGRDYYYCDHNYKYYTKVDGRWYTCIDDYYLEPDCPVRKDIEIIEEGVDTGQYLSAQERKEMYRLNRKDREEEIYAQIKRLRRKILNGVTPEEEDMYREEIDRLKSLL